LQLSEPVQLSHGPPGAAGLNPGQNG